MLSPIRAMFLILAVFTILLAGTGCKAVVKQAGGAGARALMSGGDIDCSDDNSPSVEWDEPPAIADGVLTLRGTLTDDAQLHNPILAVSTDTPLPPGQYFYVSAFSLVRLESGEVSPVGTIWPSEMRGRELDSDATQGGVIYATRYDASNGLNAPFHVQAAIPTEAQQGEGQLLVLVWPRINHTDDQTEPIGIECL